MYKGSEGLLERNTRFIEQKQRKLDELKRNKESLDEIHDCSFQPKINKNAAKTRTLDDLMTWKAKVDVKLNKTAKKNSDKKEKNMNIKPTTGPVYTNNRFMQLDGQLIDENTTKIDESVSDRLYNYKDYYGSKRLIAEKLIYDITIKSEIQNLNNSKNLDNDKTIQYKTDKIIKPPENEYFSLGTKERVVNSSHMTDLRSTKIKYLGLDEVKTPSKIDQRNIDWDKINDKLAKVINLDRSLDDGRLEYSTNKTNTSAFIKRSRTPQKFNVGVHNEGIDVYIRKVEKEMKE